MSSEIIVALLVGLGALAIGAFIGVMVQRARARAEGGPIEEQAAKLLEDGKAEAERVTRDAQLAAKEMLLQARTEAEEENKRQLGELRAERERLRKREELQEKKEEDLQRAEAEREKKEAQLAQREKTAEGMVKRSGEMLEKAQRGLEELAKLSVDQARERLIDQVRDEAQKQAAAQVRQIEQETEREAKSRATTIISSAIQRYASEYVGERTVTVVPLPSDDMKGRIIGREGRNIRALEAATGVDLIVDDTPEAVILSCFNPVRREIAARAVTRLMADGRIHPSRIEEVVQRCSEDVEGRCAEDGEQAVFDLGLHRVHPELVKLLGKLKFRSSFAQNLLQHSVEVGYIAGLIANELGLDEKRAKRAGLLHDIGKAASHEMEGSHAAVGANLAKKYGERPDVVQAIAAHHGEVPKTNVLDHLVDAANQLSAQRPGARKDRLEGYVKRLTDLESLCQKYAGVEHVFAVQAGREIRVLVENTEISDDMAVMLSKDIAKQIEGELTYPGQVMVSVVRETRASAIAR